MGGIVHMRTKRWSKNRPICADCLAIIQMLHMTHFKLEVMILCHGVSKILTANRISPIIFPSYHLIEEIRSFPTMYNTRGGSWGQFGETNHFLPKSGQKTLIFAVMVPDHLTSEWAGTHNF